MKTTINIAVLILLAVNISYVLAGSCLTNPNVTSFELTRTSKCPHYLTDTCCKADFVEGQCVRNDGCRRVPDPCSGYLDLISCALECKPDMDLFFDGDSGSLKVCAGFYDRVVLACTGSTYCPDDETDCFTDTNACLPVYENETQIWQVAVPGYSLAAVTRFDGDGICFNTAASLFNRQNVVFGLLALAVATLMF